MGIGGPVVLVGLWIVGWLIWKLVYLVLHPRETLPVVRWAVVIFVGVYAFRMVTRFAHWQHVRVF
jgi:hypothetical protein